MRTVHLKQSKSSCGLANVHARSMRTALFTLIGSAVLGACAQSEPAAPYRVVDTEAEFSALFVDKAITNEKGFSFLLKSDGTVGGDINGEVPVGTWEWKDGAYCRSFTIGAKDFPYDCFVTEVRGTNAQFKRGDGSYSSGWELGA